jgi:hypothetical protein
MNAKNQNNVVELCKPGTSTPVDMLRDLRRALSEAAAHVDLLPTALEMLEGGVIEASAFDTLRDEAYGELTITMVAVAETHGVDLYPDKHQGRAFRRIAILEAEVAARAAMTVVLRGVNAPAWDDHLLKTPKTTCVDAGAKVGLDRDVTQQDLKSPELELDKKLAEFRPKLILQLQPIAQFFGDHCGPKGMNISPGWTALSESAYRGLAVVAADVWAAHGLNVHKDQEAWKATRAVLTRAASSMADELLEGAGFQRVEPASPYIN